MQIYETKLLRTEDNRENQNAKINTLNNIIRKINRTKTINEKTKIRLQKITTTKKEKTS